MSKIRYQMKTVEKKREGKFMKASIFDPMIDEFLESGQNLVEIEAEDKSSSYIAHQLRTRIKKRGLDIVASSGGGFAYLEREPTESA